MIKRIALFLSLALAPIFIFADSFTLNPTDSLTINNTQKIKVTLKPTTASGKPVLLNVVPKWSVISGLSTISVSTDSLSAYLISSDLPGDSIIFIDAGSLAGVIKLHVIQKQATFLFNYNSWETLVFPMMKVYTSSYTSDGNYITSFSSSASGTIIYLIDIPPSNAGNYSVFARVLAKDGTSDSFFVAMDSETVKVFDAAQFKWSPNWQWCQVTKRVSEVPRVLQPVSYFLTPGLHRLIFQTRDAGTGIDQVLITNDVSITTQTLASYPTYYQDKSTMDYAQVKAIIHNQIKPVYEFPVDGPNGENQKCRMIWGIVDTHIWPIEKPYYDAWCPDCKFEPNCPWP